MPNIAKIFVAVIFAVTLAGCKVCPLPRVSENPKTFCNPLNLDYMIQPNNPCRREAADPVCVFYKGNYYLFASKSGGYWWSPDFTRWTLVTPANLPLDAYAPAVFEYRGGLYFMAAKSLCRSENPQKADSWKQICSMRGFPDPDLFLDDDGRVYMYYGCKQGGPIAVVELDPNNGFKEVSQPKDLIRSNEKEHGWEVQGDYNRETDFHYRSQVPWIEGSWMTKHNGKYYLQYAAPGTSFLTYGDGIYESNSPTGPFTYAIYSPFSFKPTGFMTGAGHSCSFQDADKHWWHIATGVVSVRHPFERRLALSPVWFDAQGRMVANTYRGDLPQFLPGKNPNPDKGPASNLAGWNLLSFGKSATASSAMAEYPVKNAFDENIKTYWSAQSGNPGEWLEVDLGAIKTVRALQVNFAEQDMEARGRTTLIAEQYIIECSADGKKWQMLADKSDNTKDIPHDYLELTGPLETRFLRLTNRAKASPELGKFAVRDFRVFGCGHGAAPGQVKQVHAARDANDPRIADIRWSPQDKAEGYIVSYGVAPDALNTHYELRGSTELKIHSLNVGVKYYFSVTAFNENGVSLPTVAK